MQEFKVERIIKEWFKKRGYIIEEEFLGPGGNKIDMRARKNQEQWIVEAKGDYDRNTAQYQVNFDTGIGQLVKSISTVNENISYAICIPFTRTEQHKRLSYRLILPKYSESIVFERLNINLILIRDDRSVEVVESKNVRKFLKNLKKSQKS